MKLSISRDKLFDALQLAGRAVSARSTLPSLGGILLLAADGKLTLRATDMELGHHAVARRGQDRAGGHRPASRPAAGRRRPQPSRRRGHDRGPQRAARRRADLRQRPLPSAHPPRRGFPPPARGRGRGREAPVGPAGRDDRAGRPRRLARRGPADPHRRAGPGGGLDADDGRHRLLPAVGQAHRDRGRRGGRAARGQRARPGAARARPRDRLGGRRRGRDRDAAQPGDLPAPAGSRSAHA